MAISRKMQMHEDPFVFEPSTGILKILTKYDIKVTWNNGNLCSIMDCATPNVAMMGRKKTSDSLLMLRNVTISTYPVVWSM